MTSAWQKRAVALVFLAMFGCASAPQARGEQTNLIERADATIESMKAQDPSLHAVLQQSAGYVVFPAVGEGGFLVGAQQGVGVVYQGNRAIGFAEMMQASFGAQAGGRAFSELIVLRTPQALERLKAGQLELTADAQATALDMGVAESASMQGDTAVFVDNESGFMAGVSVGGQRIEFEPMA
jgi:lipid-binding SYLF domain-containing protein